MKIALMIIAAVIVYFAFGIAVAVAWIEDKHYTSFAVYCLIVFWPIFVLAGTFLIGIDVIKILCGGTK